MDRKDIITNLEKVSVDLEKIRTLAYMGFDTSTPVFDDNIDEVTRALSVLRELPNVSTLFNVITDYVSSINDTIDQVTNLLYDEVQNGKKNND